MSPHVTDINRFSFDAVHRVLGSVFERDLYAKRIDSLCNATIGVLHSASLAVSAMGHGLAAAHGLATKHATKQVDRLLSNDGIKIDEILALWVPYIIGARTSIVVAMDWTAFRQRELFGVSAPLARANETPDVRRFGAFGSRQRNA
jgi:hypothetical protein